MSYCLDLSLVLLTLANKYTQRNKDSESTASLPAFAIDPYSATSSLKDAMIITQLQNLTIQMKLLFHLLRAIRAPMQ